MQLVEAPGTELRLYIDEMGTHRKLFEETLLKILNYDELLSPVFASQLVMQVMLLTSSSISSTIQKFIATV